MRSCLLLGVLLAGCVAEVGGLADSELSAPGGEDLLEEECEDGAQEEPGVVRNLHIFFVIDVSGSMEPFLRTLQLELLSLVQSLDPVVEQGGTVTYYVVGFVNDVRWFPRSGRGLTSVAEVRSAMDEAIELGETGYNLNHYTFNLEDPENLLEGLLAVLDHEGGMDRPIIIAATDAPLAEAPAVLYPEIAVAPTLEDAKQQLRQVDASVHLFAGRVRDNLEEGYRNVHDLGGIARLRSIDSVGGSSRPIRKALLSIGREAACQR